MRLPFRIGIPSALLLSVLATAGGAAQTRVFRAGGSDLLMGLGAANKAVAGAVVASTRDLYSVYWNPAGLAGIEGFQIGASTAFRTEVYDVDFVGIAFGTDLLAPLGLKTGVALAYFPRLHVESEGQFDPDDFESLFIRFTLPFLPDDFDGTISSKTREVRLGIGVAPEEGGRWRVGFGVGYIDCTTLSCGVRASDPGNYFATTTLAYSWGFYGGVQFDLGERFTLGFIFRDPFTELDVEIITEDVDGTRTEFFDVEFPKDLALGVEWRKSSNLTFYGTVQRLAGKYGVNSIDISLLRSGVTLAAGEWDLAAGLMLQLRIAGTHFADLREEAPFLPTLGIGRSIGSLHLFLAVYPDPAMTAHFNRPYMNLDLTVRLSF